MKYAFALLSTLGLLQFAHAETVCTNSNYKVEVTNYGFLVSGRGIYMDFVAQPTATPKGTVYDGDAYAFAPNDHAVLTVSGDKGLLSLFGKPAVPLVCR